jgi:hypothetical protein
MAISVPISRFRSRTFAAIALARLAPPTMTRIPDTNQDVPDINLGYGDDSSIREQPTEFGDKVPGSVFATTNDFDGAHHFTGVSQFLYGVQVGENSGIIHRP